MKDRPTMRRIRFPEGCGLRFSVDKRSADALQPIQDAARFIVTEPIEPIDTIDGSVIEFELPGEERARVDQLLERYDALLAQAEDLNRQVEQLLSEWNPSLRSSGY
jgi:hypothetical protein